MTFKNCKNAGSCGKTLCLSEFCHEFDFIVKTNAECLREMNDTEMAKFLAGRYMAVTESCVQVCLPKIELTATQKEAIAHRLYCAWMQWLQEPAEEVDK